MQMSLSGFLNPESAALAHSLYQLAEFLLACYSVVNILNTSTEYSILNTFLSIQ